ncbi:hypothetical protein [Rhodococcus sp. USK13]|uniref:hypothetical protein n=1 Tax=Rhodococcus sp. USK13 TaxID=2806442 RepID=UPI001BD0F33A|nr:hypothetical protein [Rhodococcus sp. USK13]
MTDDELITKFRHTIDGAVSDADADAVIDAVYDLANVDDISTILNRLQSNPVG